MQDLPAIKKRIKQMASTKKNAPSLAEKKSKHGLIVYTV